MSALILSILLACGSFVVPLWSAGALSSAQDRILLSPIITLQLPKKIEKQLMDESTVMSQNITCALGSLGLTCKPTSPHISLIYLKDVPLRKIDVIKKAMDEAVSLLAGKKVSFSTKQCALYGSKKDFIALELQPSVGACALEAALRKRLDYYGIDYVDFGSFLPHISLGKISLSFDKIEPRKNSSSVSIAKILRSPIAPCTFEVHGMLLTQNLMDSPLTFVAL